MEKIRINKYISDAGFCSRREADQLIVDERVTINGVLAVMGAKVSLEDKVRIDGEILRFPEIISKGDEKKNKRKSSENFSSRKDTDKLRKTLRGTRGNERKKAEKEIAMRSKSEDRARNVKKKSRRSNSR
ncbi:S4 domain-containing protein [uncultured Coprobacter sp.]|uniref:S4 domain-containing protein n=1 Tax=uncultured Coprobacter sp. TaxID=1720550 RepID=UPI00261EC48F|nr:S4 domain-containing protein [uncultured Coprobacter sp.]